MQHPQKEFLELLWQNSMFPTSTLTLTNGREIEVLRPGFREWIEGRQSGDFLYAQLRYVDSGEVVSGSVRVDSLSSQWRESQTLANAQYLSGLVLHVVGECDRVIIHNGVEVPTLVMPLIEYLCDRGERLAVECADALSQMDELHREAIFSRALSDRLENKSSEVRGVLENLQGDWHKTAIVFLIRRFGYKTTKVRYEALALELPLDLMIEGWFDRFSLEAMLLGVAGCFVEEKLYDKYSWELRERFFELSSEHKMYSRVLLSYRGRPQQNTQLQLVRLAAILSHTPRLWDKLLECEDYVQVRDIFEVELSEYWSDHLQLNAPKRGVSRLTPDKVDNLIINYLAPLLHLYGEYLSECSGDEQGQLYKDRAVEFLLRTSPEKNRFVEPWCINGFYPRDSFQTQALIQLKDVHCSKGGAAHCYACPLGGHLMMEYYAKVRAALDKGVEVTLRAEAAII